MSEITRDSARPSCGPVTPGWRVAVCCRSAEPGRSLNCRGSEPGTRDGLDARRPARASDKRPRRPAGEKGSPTPAVGKPGAAPRV